MDLLDPVTALCPEVCLLIFSYLDPDSVKNAALVSRDWREVILSDSGKFWRWAVLHVDPVKYPSQAEDLLTSRILSIISEIEISPTTGTNILESLLKFVGQGDSPHLKKIMVNSLDNIDPILVSRAALKVQEFTGGLWPDQLQAILTGIQDSNNSCLKSLASASGSLVQVSPDVLAGAAVKLESLVAEMSSDQVETILTRIAATQGSKLRELITEYQTADLSGMDPEVLAQALVKLETVGYSGLLVDLSPDQVLAFFSRIRDSPDLKITELDLTWDVSLVPPEVFAGSLSRLESVWFGAQAGVTPSQLKSLFLQLFSHQEEAGGSTLKQLIFYDIDLTSVSPEVLVGAIQRLEEVKFSDVEMTSDQRTSILTMVKENQHGRLKYIRIMFNRDRGVGSVSPSLIREASLNKSLDFFYQ